MDNRLSALALCCLAVTAVFVVSIWIWVIWDQRPYVVRAPPGGVCPVLPSASHLVLFKNLWSQYHWFYATAGQDDESHRVYVTCACPSLTRDAVVSVGAHTVAYTDGQTMSPRSVARVRDCTHRDVATLATGSFWMTLLNTNRIFVELLVYGPGGETTAPVGFVRAFNLLGNSVEVRDRNDTLVATLRRNVIAPAWTWTIDALRPDAGPAGDMRVLAALAGRIAFAPASDKDDGDGCNSFFFGATYFLLAVAIGLGVLVLGGLFVLVASPESREIMSGWNRRAAACCQAQPCASPPCCVPASGRAGAVKL